MTSIGARALRTRWFVRSPIPLFRAGLGFLFGGRLLLLQHTAASPVSLDTSPWKGWNGRTGTE